MGSALGNTTYSKEVVDSLQNDSEKKAEELCVV